MIRLLLVVVLLAGIANTAAAEDRDDAPQCLGMAKELSLPDVVVFKFFVDLDNERFQKQYGNRSDKHLVYLQLQSYEQGYGTGLAHATNSTKGAKFAFDVFMKICYDNNAKMRKDLLAKLADK